MRNDEKSHHRQQTKKNSGAIEKHGDKERRRRVKVI